MGAPKGIRWPEDLAEEIERARIQDGRNGFSDEVFYLVRLGLEEAEWQRKVIAEAKEARRSPSAKNEYEPLRHGAPLIGPEGLAKRERNERRKTELDMTGDSPDDIKDKK